MLLFYKQFKKKASVAEWSIATDCKSVDESLRWFKSNPAHTLINIFVTGLVVFFCFAITNVFAADSYDLYLKDTGRSAIFTSPNSDNLEYTFSYAFVEKSNQCTPFGVENVSQTNFNPKNPIQLRDSNHQQFLCITENNGTTSYQPTAPLYVNVKNIVLTVSRKSVSVEYSDQKNLHQFIVDDDYDYNDKETGTLYWAYVPFADVCDSNNPKKTAYLFGFKPKDQKKPIYSKYDKDYGEDFVYTFFNEQSNLQNITDDEGKPIEIKLKPLRINTKAGSSNIQPPKTNTICFLSAHPKYDAYAVKGHTLSYVDNRLPSGSSASPTKPSSFLDIFNRYKKTDSIKNFIGNFDFAGGKGTTPPTSGNQYIPEISSPSGGIVPCGKNAAEKCDIDDLETLSSNLIKYIAFYLFIPLAAFGIFFSGIKYLFFAESPEARNAAKNNLIWTVVAFLLVFGAFTLIDYFFTLTGVEIDWKKLI